MTPCDVGLVGLGVIGRNLALNLAGKGYRVALFNRREAGEEAILPDFVAQHGAGLSFQACHDLAAMVARLARPRRILLTVTAGGAVDDLLGRLLPLLEPGDIVVDAGNSHYRDSLRRQLQCEARGLCFVGCGLSGGAQGALTGPALMPGGSASAWPELRGLLQAIAARNAEGIPCCDWIGPAGSGHFVKLVHNGIEYAWMQGLAECYDLQKRLCGLSAAESAAAMSDWNRGPLHGYLLEISARILRQPDTDGTPLIERILDCAGQKGSGQDIAIAALELGVPVPALTEAINARFLSTLLAERLALAAVPECGDLPPEERLQALSDLPAALWCAQMMVVAQGCQLLATASARFGWNLDLPRIAGIWSGGCIIRSRLLAELAPAMTPAGIVPLLGDATVSSRLAMNQTGWRRTLGRAVAGGIPVPVLASTLAFFDGMRSAQLPANLLQAQRDYFGAHGFERRDTPRGVSCHADWDET